MKLPASLLAALALITPVATAQDSEETSLVMSALEEMDGALLQRAFERLSEYAHTRYSRTEQRIAGLATMERITRHSVDSSVTVLSERASGDFTANGDGAEPKFLHRPEHIIPEDPPYLSERFREAFEYRFLPDTLLWGRETQVIAIRARPGAPHAVRHARYYLDRASNSLVALFLERSAGGMFFTERSRYFLQLRPGPHRAWVPHHIHVESRLALPFRRPRKVSRTATFYSYGAA